MTPTLTDDQRQAIREHGGSPVYVVDAATNASYVILPVEQYEHLRAGIGGDEAEELYPLLADLSPEDWEDASRYGAEQP